MGRKKLVLSTAESHVHFCIPVFLSQSLCPCPSVPVHCPCPLERLWSFCLRVGRGGYESACEWEQRKNGRGKCVWVGKGGGEGSMCEWVGGTRVRGACVGARREAWERKVCEGTK